MPERSAGPIGPLPDPAECTPSPPTPVRPPVFVPPNVPIGSVWRSSTDLRLYVGWDPHTCGTVGLWAGQPVVVVGHLPDPGLPSHWVQAAPQWVLLWVPSGGRTCHIGLATLQLYSRRCP